MARRWTTHRSNTMRKGLVATAIILTAVPASAQSRPDAPATTTEDAASRTIPTRTPSQTIELMPEGTGLVNVRGTIRRHESLPNWVLSIRDPRASSENVELIMLPNRRLEDMELALATAADGERLTFEVTGEAFVYGRRNYLLATMSPRLVNRQRSDGPPEDERAATSSGERSSESASTMPAGDDTEDDDSIEAIMRRLDETAGAIPRAAVDTRSHPADDAWANLHDGSLVVNRRGHAMRDTAGGWRFVFDADAHGLDDPAVTIMPCLMLERIERHVSARGRTAPLLISGRVYAYRGRRFLLPTMMQLPRERTRLGGVNTQ